MLFRSDIFVFRFAKIWQTTETYSPQTFSVTAAVVAPAVAICLNSLFFNTTALTGIFKPKSCVFYLGKLSIFLIGIGNQAVPFVGNWGIGNREFKQIATAGANTAVVTEKVWGEYVSVVGQILAKRNTKMSET